MKKKLIPVLFALALSPCVAHAVGIGVGVFGGAGVPILQDDNGQGTVFGLRVPVNLVPLVTVEPYFSKGSGGDKDQDVGGLSLTRSGIDATSFGANVMLKFGGGLSFYPYAGIGSTKLERDGLDATSTSYNFGLGLGLSPVPKISVHLRGELQAVLDKDESDISRKWANITLGVHYNLFP
jgi:opacity protein-like surface antigen